MERKTQLVGKFTLIVLLLGCWFDLCGQLSRRSIITTEPTIYSKTIDLHRTNLCDCDSIKESAINKNAVLPEKALSPKLVMSGLPITRLTDGFTQFLIKRTKEELTISAFSKFNRFLQKDTIYLSTFIPRSKSKLESISSEIYDFDLYIKALRDAFILDLNSLPTNLQTYLLLNPGFVEDEVVRTILLDGFSIAQKFVDSEMPEEILSEFLKNDSRIMRSTDSRLKTTRQILMISRLMLNTMQNGQGGFISADQLQDILQDNVLRCQFLCLVYEEAKKPEYLGIVDALPEQEILEIKLIEINQIVNDLNALIEEVRLKQVYREKIDYADYVNYVTSILNVIEFGYNILNINAHENDKIHRPTFFTVLDNASLLVLKITQKQYSAAVLNLKEILLEIYPDTACDETLKDVRKKRGVIRMAELTEVNRVELKKVNGEIDSINAKCKSLKTISTVIDYISFVAGVAEANSAEEIAQVIETFALPAGSSVTKRKSSFTFSLNTYTGGFIGSEKLLVDKEYHTAGTSGITAPIGLGISTRHRLFWAKEPRNSFNAFVSLLDVGAVFAYRFDDENTADLPEITLKNIFAPGIFLESSLFNSPFTIGAGYQWSPGIRKITAEGNMPPTLEMEAENAQRLMVTLKVDLPLVFFARGRKAARA